MVSVPFTEDGWVHKSPGDPGRADHAMELTLHRTLLMVQRVWFQVR